MFWLKLIHTLIAAVNASAVFYILYCGLRDRHGLWLNISLVILAIELACLAIFRGDCPLQLYARQQTGSHAHVSDLFLPDWMALSMIPFFTPITLVALGLVARNQWRRYKDRKSAP
ncbi:hypothetical protein ACFOOP_11730 [Marinicaulis aureus]|uniref:DUF2784 domain-containing protein n=1 Tax=Hyphococcus aureus TaxID=2666033 RepID=A0ABW1KZP8_9PROT